MDRRKSEARLQLKKLQDECRSTVNLLNELLGTCSSQIDALDTIGSKDYRLHSQYLIAVTQFQFQTFQKLLEINIDLEEYLDLKQLPSLKQFENENVPVDIVTPKPLQLSIDLPSVELKKSENIKVQLDVGVDVASVQISNDPPKVAAVPKETIINEQRSQDKIVTVPEPSQLDEEVPSVPLNQSCSNNTIKTSTIPKQINNVAVLKTNQIPKADPVIPKQINNVAVLKTKQLPKADPVTASKVKEQKTAEINIMDKLRSISERMPGVESTIKPVPGVCLQSTSQKMSDVVKDKLVHCDQSLTTVDPPSSEEDLAFEESKFFTDIPQHAAPVVNDLCMIGHIVSPSHFYIQVADENSSMLDLISVQLESLSTANCSMLSKVEARRALGNFSCLKIDNLWYRVEVLDWMLNVTGLRQDEIVVHLIDYGNTFHINYRKLSPMLTEFLEIPRMAQLCHLDGLYPPGSTRTNKLTKWPEESKDGFFNICGDLNRSIFQVSHVRKDLERNSFAIDITNTNETNSENSIGQILLDANLAVELLDQPIIGNTAIMNQILMSHGLQNVKPNMTRDEILELYFAESGFKEARNINEAVMDYNPRDEALTCKNLRSDGTCYKGDRCTLRHVPLKDGFTRDRHPVYNRAFVDTPMPRTGDSILLTISHVNSLQRFYAQIRSPDKDCDKPGVNALISDMNKVETVKLYKELRYPPALSQLVIVKHWNGHWYRGQVKNVVIPENGNVTVEVYVVDFGDTLVVPMCELRNMLAEFLTIPIQAIECRLYNVRHKDGADEAEEKRYFESRYLGQTFHAKIMAVPGYLEVELFTKENENLGIKLIDDGYGQENLEHIFPKDNELYLVD